jgi:hypothetical protein
MRTTRLSELVQQGRIVVHSGAVTAGAGGPDALDGPQAQPLRPALHAARSQPRVHDDIADTIELLAIQLLSISKSCRADPEAVLREALLSMEECITAIASQRRPTLNHPPTVHA